MIIISIDYELCKRVMSTSTAGRCTVSPINILPMELWPSLLRYILYGYSVFEFHTWILRLE